MEIIVNAAKTAYTDWCAFIVASLFDSRNITFNGREINMVEINAVDETRIYLSIFNLPFTIRIWNSIMCEEESDEDGYTETVGYTFYCSAINTPSEDCFIPSGDGEPLCGGYLRLHRNYDDID